MDLYLPKTKVVLQDMESSLLMDNQDFIADSLSQSNASVCDPSELGSMSSMDDSVTEYLGNVSQCISLREKYKKEFKAAIKDSYKYMMNQDMVESCKFIEEELSAFDSDDVVHEAHAVSYNEFIRQYEDLKDWLKAICEQITHSSPLCLSEKYLNQAHHEELLQRLTRRTQFDEYATQLISRYPSLKEDIINKRTNVNKLWADLQRIVTSNDSGNHLNVLKDVELDLSNFESWLVGMDKSLNELQHQTVFSNISKDKLLEVVKAQHKEVQPKSKFVNSMLQMCDNLLSSCTPLPPPIENKIIAAKNRARALQHQWESLFIQILEWQLRIEEDYNTKHRWNINKSDFHGSLEAESDSGGIFKIDCNTNVLPIINEDMEENNIKESHSPADHPHLKQVDDKFIDHTREKPFYNHDVGYSSEGQQSQNSLKLKCLSESNKQPCCCNVGSDFSDSSGIGISTATGSCIGKNKSEIPSAKINNEDLETRPLIEQESSMPCTEDEFSSDEVPISSTVCTRFTQSLDNLNSATSDKCPSLTDSALSDGELMHDNMLEYNMFSFRVTKKQLCKSKRPQRKTVSEILGNEFLKAKKYPKKRKLSDNVHFQASKSLKGNLFFSKIPKIQSDDDVKKLSGGSEGNFNGVPEKDEDQLVPSIATIGDDILSEVEISDDDLDLNPDLHGKGVSCRHSTPKTCRKLYNQTDFESDSDVEDFRIMMEDSLKALSYTKNCVAHTIKSSKRVMDSVEFLEPLATCRTSVKCLKELEEAFYSVKGRVFSTLDILKLQALVKDWTALESQILHHLESGKQLILSEFDLLQNQISLCENAVSSTKMSEVEFSFEAFLNAIHSYRTEKGKLLGLHKNIRELKKSVSPLTNKNYPTDVSCYSDLALRLEYFASRCQTLLMKVETLLSSYLEVFEPCMNFYKLSQNFDELLDQSETCLGMSSVKLVHEPEFVALLSCKIKEIELKIMDKLNKMDNLLMSVGHMPHVHHHFLKKVENSRLALRNFEIKKESLFEGLLLLEKSNFSGPDHGQASGLHKVAKKIIKFGLPVSVALLLGWIYSSSSGLCKESFDDWSFILFPSLQHTRGRPPI